MSQYAFLFFFLSCVLEKHKAVESNRSYTSLDYIQKFFYVLLEQNRMEKGYHASVLNSNARPSAAPDKWWKWSCPPGCFCFHRSQPLLKVVNTLDLWWVSYTFTLKTKHRCLWVLLSFFSSVEWVVVTTHTRSGSGITFVLPKCTCSFIPVCKKKQKNYWIANTLFVFFIHW